MNREIKFRAKTMDSDEWAFGYYQLTVYSKAYQRDFNLNKDEVHYIYPAHIDSDPKEIIKSTLGQFTGLKDKNGVDIYEGDILKDDRGRLITIEWHNIVSSFCLVYDQSFRHYFGEAYNPDQLEVIGSIHSNPELIK